MKALGVSNAQKTLAATLGVRLALVFGLIIAAQVGACLYQNLGDPEYFARNYVETEVDLIGGLLQSSDGAVILDTTRIPSYYTEQLSPYYAFRIVDANGKLIGESNGQILSNFMPIFSNISKLPFAWFGVADTIERFHIAGGAPSSVNGQAVWIEVATLGDPDWQRLWVLIHELVKDVSIPLFLIVLVALPVAILTVRESLKPLKVAARQAAVIDASVGNFQITNRNIPLEVGVFVAAINQLLAKYHDLLLAQQRLVLHTSHELRTPLALMLLELSQMPGDGARCLERDVTNLADLVNRTLQLGRIEAMQSPCQEEVKLVQAADDAIRSLQPLVEQRGCVVELEVRDEASFMGDLQSIREATRNLIENAIKHNPIGTRVRVTCGPGFAFKVEDSGRGVPDAPLDQLFEPFSKGSPKSDGVGLGLAIVKKTVDLHKGRINVRASELGGACFEIEFPQTAKI